MFPKPTGHPGNEPDIREQETFLCGVFRAPILELVAFEVPSCIQTSLVNQLEATWHALWKVIGVCNLALGQVALFCQGRKGEEQ